MNNTRKLTLAGSIFLLPAVSNIHAHTSYGGGTPAARDFGAFDPTAVIGQSVTKNGSARSVFGWADGTDADFGDAHRIQAYRFTLANAGNITISVSAITAGFLPGFTIYSGLLNLTGGSPADGEVATQTYLASLGAPQPREGALNSLGNVIFYNSAGNESNITYVNNAADGTIANFGNAAGINGDGIADGVLSSTFNLAAGNYTLFIGGANYNDPTNNGTAYSSSEAANAFTTTVSVVPEPTTFALLAGAGALGLIRRPRR